MNGRCSFETDLLVLQSCNLTVRIAFDMDGRAVLSA